MPARDPVSYVLRHKVAWRLNLLLAREGARPYEETRQRLEVDATTFHRVTRALAQLNLVTLRAPKGAEFDNNRIRLAIQLSTRGRDLQPVFEGIHGVLKAHEASLPASTKEYQLAGV